jgi:hypothetical protein
MIRRGFPLALIALPLVASNAKAWRVIISVRHLEKADK